MNRHNRCSWWVILSAFVLILSLVAGPLADTEAKRRKKPPKPPAASWQLAFNDDFDGQSLDEGKWTSEFPWGRDRSSVGELQYYAPDAFNLNNGRLAITAKPATEGSHQYHSGLISSHKSFAPEFGRFEIRCKLPRGQGLWPAFWLLPSDTSWPPEIDVFEALGHEPNQVHMVAHWSEAGEHQQSGEVYSGPDFSSDFHTFAVEWTAETLVWFVDGVKRHEVIGKSPRGPMYLIANLAVGGNWPGEPDATTQFPATFEIDYIRAYQQEAAPAAKESKAPHKEKNGRKDGNNQKRRRRAIHGKRGPAQ